MWCLRTGTETTYSWKTASLNDWCKLQKSRLSSHDWRLPGPKHPIKKENIRTRRVRIKSLFPAELKMSIYSKEFLAIYMAFFEFAHILWETSKLTIVLTDNKSVTRFFQTKAIPPSLWNACDSVLLFNFKMAHIASSVNTAVDFLSRLELKITEKIHLKIQEGVQIIPKEVSTSSSDGADEEQVIFTQADAQDETEEQIPHRKEQSQKKAAELVVNQEPSSMKPSIKGFTKIDGNMESRQMHEYE